MQFDPERRCDSEHRTHRGVWSRQNGSARQIGRAKQDAWHMIVPAVGGFAVFVLVDRYATVIVVMMVGIHADLRHAMRGLVHRPGRNRHAHSQRQPKKGEQAQQRAGGVIHGWLGRRPGKIGQSGFWQVSRSRNGERAEAHF